MAMGIELELYSSPWARLRFDVSCVWPDFAHKLAMYFQTQEHACVENHMSFTLLRFA